MILIYFLKKSLSSRENKEIKKAKTLKSKKNMNNFFEEEKTIDDGTNTNDLVLNVSNSDVEAIQGMKSIDLGSQGVYAAWTDCLFAMDVPPLITKDYDGYGETEAKKAVAFAVGARYPIILKILME